MRGTQPKGGYFHCKTCLGNISPIVHPREQRGEPAGIRVHHPGTGTVTAEAALWTPHTWVIPEEFHTGISARGRRCPSEKPQVWGTWMPNAVPFPIPPWALLPGAPAHSTALAGHSTWEYSWNQLWAQTALWEIRVLGLFLHLPAPAARRQVPRCDVTVMEHRLETFPGSWSHQLHPADCQDQEAGWKQPSCGKISQNGAVFTGDILCF